MSTDLVTGKQKQRNEHLHTSGKHLSSPFPGSASLQTTPLTISAGYTQSHQ